MTLTCQTYRGSFQRLTWFKPDGQSGDKTVLELVKISRNEAGEYRCEVHSECGNETANFFSHFYVLCFYVQ